MVIRGGENIFPREIEEFLFEHPKSIADVPGGGCARTRAYGEELCACIMNYMTGEIGKRGGDARLLSKSNIAHFKIPQIHRLRRELPHDRDGQGSEVSSCASR